MKIGSLLRFSRNASQAVKQKAFYPSVDCIKSDSIKLTVLLNDKLESVVLPVVWMRWNCQSPKSRQSGTGQKIVDPAKWPKKLEFENAWIDGETVFFQTVGEDHIGQMPLSSLIEYMKKENQRKNGATRMTFHNYPNEWIPRLSFDDIQTGKGQQILTNHIATNGYCLVSGCPTGQGDVVKIAKTISPPIPSVYGETFDVVSEENPNNIAYSTVGLGPHVDLTYLEAPPGLQFFLCRRQDECVDGGDSTLVDAFAAAEDLRRKHPHHFETLASTLVRFQKIHYERDRPVDLEWESTHFVLGSDGDVVRVNWAPAFEGMSPMESCTQSYLDAYRAYMKALDESKTNFVKKLSPGECLVFNNRKMLHGRKEFKLNGGVRHLEGCYTNLCEFRSRAQVLENLHGNQTLIQKVGNGNNI